MADTVERISGVHASTSMGGGNGTPAKAASQAAAGGKHLPQQSTRRGVGTQNHAEAAASALNAYLEGTNHELRFRMDRASGDIVVSVVDTKTNKVIRQFPPEELLKLAATLKRLGKLDTTGLRSRA